MAILAGEFKNLQATVGAFINNALQPVVAWLIEIIKKANEAFKSIANMLGIKLKGDSNTVANNINTSATGASNLADGLGSAAKNAKKLKKSACRI